MKIAALVVLALSLSIPASAADGARVFIFAGPDPALGGLVSAGLEDSADDLKTLLVRMGVFRTLKVTDTRADATMLVQVISRDVVNDEYRVQVKVTLPDGSTRDLVGSNTRQWKRCMRPIAAALRDLSKAQLTAAATPR